MMKHLFKIMRRPEKGFTLIEVMVAITLLMIIILPLASLYVKSLSTIQGAALYSQALTLAKSRMELVSALDYDDLEYTNIQFCPGFPFDGPLLPYYQSAADGTPYGTPGALAYDTRDNPDTTNVEWGFDPTRGGSTRDYPIPVYRDYYNNFTGQLIDPNYNGLCDDDLNGDGIVDAIDRFIGNPNRDTYGAGAYNNQDVAGDGLYDTVVEGMYAGSFDPTQWRKTWDVGHSSQYECVSPIPDFGLSLDNEHLAVTRDYRHREKTFENFVRMTTIIDPTPRLADPHHPDAFNDFVDHYYFWDRWANDGYTDKQLLNLSLCLERDLPLMKGFNSRTVDVGSEDVYDIVGTRGTGLEETDPFKVNYTTPLYGKKVIVTVFYLSGDAEVVYQDLDGDGIPEELPGETYATARHLSLERVFVNKTLLTGAGSILNRITNYRIPGLVADPFFGGSTVAGIRLVPPQRRFTIGDALTTADGSVEIPDITSGIEYDPCSEANDGLPYLGDRYWF